MNRTRIIIALCIGLVNVAIALSFEAFRPRHLTYDGLWNARTALWAGLLLVDNLIVVWWYASLTGKAVEAAQSQARVTRDQFRLAQEEQNAKKRPCVVIDWKYLPPRLPTSPHGHTYVARNVGPGLALNVVYVEDLVSCPDGS